MGKSRKRTPIFGYGNTSRGAMKTFRTQENKAFRRLSKQMLSQRHFNALPSLKEYQNECFSPRDGKGYWDDPLDILWIDAMRK